MTTAAKAGSLKIADTPQEDGDSSKDQATSPEGEASNESRNAEASAEAPATDEKPTASASKKRRAKGVTKLTSEQMDSELDRVNLSNGKPVLARGTTPDSPGPSAEPGAGEANPAVATKSNEPKGKKRKKPGKPEETKEEHHARRIHEAQENLCRISMEHSESADLTKSLKKQRDVATQYLADLLHEGPEDLPLIDAANEARKQAELNGSASSGQKELPLSNAGQSPDAWRSVSLGELGEFGMSVRTHKALIEQNKIETLGSLADFSNANRGQLVKLKGIGKVAAEQLQDSLDKFWKKNPQLVPSEEQAGPAVADGSDPPEVAASDKKKGKAKSKSPKAAKAAKAANANKAAKASKAARPAAKNSQVKKSKKKAARPRSR